MDSTWETVVRLHLIRTSLFFEIKLRGVVNLVAYLDHIMPDCDLLKDQQLSLSYPVTELVDLLEHTPSKAFEITRSPVFLTLIHGSSVCEYSALAQPPLVSAPHRFAFELSDILRRGADGNFLLDLGTQIASRLL